MGSRELSRSIGKIWADTAQRGEGADHFANFREFRVIRDQASSVTHQVSRESRAFVKDRR